MLGKSHVVDTEEISQTRARNCEVYQTCTARLHVRLTGMHLRYNNGLSTQVPYDVPSRCSVAEHKLRVTAFCVLRNILHHTGSVMEHHDGTHRSLHDICSVFISRCTGFGMLRPVLYVFLKYRKFIHFTCSFLVWRCFLAKLVIFFVVSTRTGCHLSVCGRAKKQDLFLF